MNDLFIYYMLLHITKINSSDGLLSPTPSSMLPSDPAPCLRQHLTRPGSLSQAIGRFLPAPHNHKRGKWWWLRSDFGVSFPECLWFPGLSGRPGGGVS